MNILRLPIDQIDPGQRLRPVDPDYVQLIAASMAERGQMTPIEVIRSPGGGERPYTLVSGAHRLAAASEAGMTDVDATVFEGSALEAELREIDENLIRHELKELDRSTFLARRKEVYERLYPDTKHGGKREAGQVAKVGDLSERFSAEAAERLGLSERTVQRAIQRFNRIGDEVRGVIAGLWVADNGAALDALAKLPAREQMRVAELLRDNPGMRSVNQAMAAIAGVEPVEPDTGERLFEAFLRLWRRMAPPVRRRVRDFVADWAGAGE